MPKNIAGVIILARMHVCDAKFRIGEKLRMVLKQRSQRCGLSDPVPGILLGTSDDDEQERYMLGFYERDELPVDDPVTLVQTEGIDLLIPQARVLELLAGNTLEIIDGRLTVIE